MWKRIKFWETTYKVVRFLASFLFPLTLFDLSMSPSPRATAVAKTQRNLVFLARGTRKSGVCGWRVMGEILERKKLDGETNSKLWTLYKVPSTNPELYVCWTNPKKDSKGFKNWTMILIISYVPEFCSLKQKKLNILQRISTGSSHKTSCLKYLGYSTCKNPEKSVQFSRENNQQLPISK